MAKAKKLDTGELMDVLIYVLFASLIIPIIAGQLSGLEGDTGNFSAGEILIIGVITTFIILGVAYSIIKKMF